MMRSLLAALTVLLAGSIVTTPSFAQYPPASAAHDSLVDAQAREVSSQLRCVVCQGLSIQDSPSSLAQEMRRLVREQLAAGRTPEQVRQYFVDKYGEFVLLEPKPSGFNLLVYVLPIVMLVGGAGFVLLKARQWTRRSTASPDEARV